MMEKVRFGVERESPYIGTCNGNETQASQHSSHTRERSLHRVAVTKGTMNQRR